MRGTSWTRSSSALMGFYLTPSGMIADDATTHDARWDAYSRVRICTRMEGGWGPEYFRVRSKSPENELMNAVAIVKISARVFTEYHIESVISAL